MNIIAKRQSCTQSTVSTLLGRNQLLMLQTEPKQVNLCFHVRWLHLLSSYQVVVSLMCAASEKPTADRTEVVGMC